MPPARPLRAVMLAVVLPALATLAVPGGRMPLLAGGLGLVALIGVLAWLTARAVSEPDSGLAIAFATATAVALLAPVPASFVMPALLGIAWLRRRPPVPAANDNPQPVHPAFEWTPVRSDGAPSADTAVVAGG